MNLNGIELRWRWEQPDPLRSGSSGDLAKLFRNEGVKEPGLLAAGAPNQVATVMAREVIQNSWDAAKELQDELLGSDIDPPTFEIEFRFRSVVGEDKRDLVDRLDLAGLAAHVAPGNRAVLGLRETDGLEQIENAHEPLRILSIVERGATGMFGPFTSANSKLYLALISIGYTLKHEGAGGSFGYGKAGLIRASAIRSLVAYTCFGERDDDAGVTKRLLGMTYWGQHDLNGQSYTGFARFGQPEGDSALPFENAAADQVAEALGIELRDASDLEDRGTTILLLDPAVGPDELREAIERNWWPALIGNEFVARILTDSDETIVPRPRRNPALSAFTRSLELATTSQDNSVPWELRKDLGDTYAVPNKPLSVGTLGAVADLEGWSYPDMEHTEEGVPIEHRSLVALVRGPRMVVEYLDLGHRTPLVRGAFVADPSIDDLLRQSEPKAHDAWQTNTSEEGIDPAAPKVAKSVLTKIRNEVRDFQQRMRPPPPKDEDVRLPVLQDLFKRLIDGRAPAVPKGPNAVERDVAITVRQEVVPVDPATVRLVGSASFRLADRIADEVRPVRARIAYVYLENDRAGETCTLVITSPAGWEADNEDGSYVGELSHEASSFRFESTPYAADWSGRLSVTADMQASEP